MTAVTGIEVRMSVHPRIYSRVTREALTMMGGLIRFARKQRKMSEAELAARAGIARSTLQLIEKGHNRTGVRGRDASRGAAIRRRAFAACSGNFADQRQVGAPSPVSAASAHGGER